ncbi:MAG: PBP1A family penicillin-binding protein [Hyphomicrobiales bacterium]|nr:PBP1A family penicillin-binding protein [Hyphomicrobiales bacterium]
MFESGRRWRDAYADFSAFMDRFHVSGLRRLGVELGCEILTLGLGGALVALTFAQLAFSETSDDWLKKQDLAVTFQDRYGVEVGRRGILHDDSVTLDQLPDYLIKAVLATEDRRFFDHWGFDPIGTLRAFTVNARASGVVQGGSTITQQLAKNLFLSNERTLERKIREVFLAVWLEFHLTKREILKLYLDRVYMGGGTFGVQAAAEFYFGKSVKDVSLAEAAMLAGLFKAPTKFAPHVNLPAARARAADVLNNLVDAGFMTQSQIFAALRNPATPVERDRESSPDWYLDWAFNEVKKLSDDGKLGNDRVLTVRTALDSKLQEHAEDVIEEQLREHGAAYHAKQAATVLIEPYTGAVRAIVGGRDYGTSQFNRATDALRQPGSSFKPYVYLTAILSGRFTPQTIVNDAPLCLGNWCPHNYGGRYYGRLPLAEALAKSLNTIAVRLSIDIGDPRRRGDWEAAKIGRAMIRDTARKMGVTAPLIDTVSMPIGADEVSVIEHSASYSVFANGGKRVFPYAAVEIRNSRGEPIYKHDSDGRQPERIFPEQAIVTMDSMLTKVVEEGTGKRAMLPGIKVGGKTGTTNAYKDAWFCGFTANLNGCVWYGNDDDTSMANMTGGSLPAQTWHDIMEPALRGVELRPLPGFTLDAAPQVAVARPAAQDANAATAAPATLTHRANDALGAVEKLLRAPDKRATGDPSRIRIIAGGREVR